MKQKIDVVFSKKNSAQKLLYQYLVNEVELIIEAITIFYLPMALIEEAAPEDKVDRAADESIAKLKAQIEIIEIQRSRYTGIASLSMGKVSQKLITVSDESAEDLEDLVNFQDSVQVPQENLEDLFILLKKL